MRQGEVAPLIHCWPIDTSGPLPAVLADPYYIGDAFFRSLPQSSQYPIANIRRGLKRAAEDVGIQFDRTNVRFDLRERDCSLAFQFASQPAGRAALRKIEIVEERGRGKRRAKQRVSRIDLTLPKVLWAHYETHSKYANLVEWVKSKSVARPDLGRTDAYYLTPASLSAALHEELPPVALDDPDLARIILLFAALLPTCEAVDLIEIAVRSGISKLGALGAESPVEISHDLDIKHPVEAQQNPYKGTASMLPRLSPAPGLVPTFEPLPALSYEAVDLSQAIENAVANARLAEEGVWAMDGSFAELLDLDDVGYAARISAIDYARDARATLRKCAVECHEFLMRSLARALVRADLEKPSWLGSIESTPLEKLADTVRAADALSTLAKPEIEPSVYRLWRSDVAETRNLFELLEAFRQLPSFRKYVEAHATREVEYVARVHAFVCMQAKAKGEIVAWLNQLSPTEVSVLLDSIDPARWPVAAALLIRLGLDGEPEFTAVCEHRLAAAEDSAVRRDLLSFVDPTSVVFDSHPSLQRIIIAERMRDILTFGPLVVITDPSLRLSEETLVGAPIAELANLIVHHLDLIGNGAELRRLAKPGKEPEDSIDDVTTDLLTYATTTSTSSGLYLQLREAVRERHFAPLVHQGRIDSKVAAALAKSFDVEDAIELAVADVRRDTNRNAQIESRHRARIQGYVRAGKDLLDAYVQKMSRQPLSRQQAFRAELVHSLSLLCQSPAQVGSRDWLEYEVRAMLVGPEMAIESATLRGDPIPIFDRAWVAEDTAWAQQSIEFPEFYLKKGAMTVEVAATAIRLWAMGNDLSSRELLEELLVQGEYGAAHTYLGEIVVTPHERHSLQNRVAEAAHGAIAPLQVRLAKLESEHGAAMLGSLETAKAVRDALQRFEVHEAAELLDLVEMEVAELAELRRRDALDASSAIERVALLRRLLQAGVEGPDERWKLADLEERWKVELRQRAPERAHLGVIKIFLDAGKALPELADDAERFSARMLEPDSWLPERRATELVSFIKAPAEKLKTWIQLAGQLDEPQRLALIEVARWFVRFVDEQTTTLGALDESASTDTVLERALEVGDLIEQAPDPAACARGLGVTHEVMPSSPRLASVRALVPEAISAKLMPLVEEASWSLLAEAARSLRLEISDEDVRRMADVAEFADTLTALAEGRVDDAREGLVTASRVLGASGHVINRALPLSRLLAIAFDVFAAALALGSEPVSQPAQSQADGSWAPLLNKRLALQQVLVTNNLAARTLEQLCAGSIGREVVNRLWEAPTATAEPGVLRAALLGFLYERGFNEHILFLAGRHEPGIRSRLDQLLNLRALVSQRPDLVPVSEAVASQVANTAQGVPFRNFVGSLPAAAQAIEANLVVSVDNDIVLRMDKRKPASLPVTISIEPRGLVPESLEAVLFPDDDVSFDDGSRRRRLSEQPMYLASQWTVGIKFGERWSTTGRDGDDNFRIRINARILTGELINRDVVCQLTRADVGSDVARRIDDETLLEAFPGVENTPARGDAFIGRHEELERLHGTLIGSRRPSPVLLTGMRRIGKTSLLYAFHDRHRRPERDAPMTIYFSLAERRGNMMDPRQQVSAVFYSAIAHALGKRHFSSTDLNSDLGEKLRQRLGTDRDAVRNAILGLYDPESLADSITVLSERLLDWAGGATRVIFLLDEAETLVLPFRGGEVKRLELEQLLQGLREVSQTSTKVGLLLSGSNHIAEFARSYKNAFFGSSLQIDLAGMTTLDTARKLISPDKLAPYIAFKGEPVRYAIEMCAGMPQFLWQLGAAISAIVRSGSVTKADVRQGVSALVGESSVDLPFKAYDVLEPIEHMLGLLGQREQDLHWLLLSRVATSSSLVVDEAQQSFIIDQSLLELDEFESWKSRLLSLVDLEILEMPRSSMYRFRVPIFAEGFRAPRHHHVYRLRHQRAGT